MLKSFSKPFWIALALLLMVAVTPVALAAPPVQDDQTIVDIAANDGRFTTLVAALQAAGLDRTLSGPGPFTVFAPTDDAFAALPEGTVDALMADIPALSDVLLYHVVSGKLMAADVEAMAQANTLLGEPAAIAVGDDGTVMVGNATIIIADIEGSNGVIHVIDAVLLPPSMQMDSAEPAPMAEPEAEAPAPAEEMAEPEAEAPAPAEEVAEAEADAAATEEMAEDNTTADGQAGSGFYYPRNPYYGYYGNYGYNYYPRYNSCYYNCYRPYYNYRPYYPRVPHHHYYYPMW